jgi:hypothetical protein
MRIDSKADAERIAFARNFGNAPRPNGSLPASVRIAEKLRKGGRAAEVVSANGFLHPRDFPADSVPCDAAFFLFRDATRGNAGRRKVLMRPRSNVQDASGYEPDGAMRESGRRNGTRPVAARAPESAPELDLLTTDEAAALLRRKPDTLKWWREEGAGPAYVQQG